MDHTVLQRLALGPSIKYVNKRDGPQCNSYQPDKVNEYLQEPKEQGGHRTKKFLRCFNFVILAMWLHMIY